MKKKSRMQNVILISAIILLNGCTTRVPVSVPLTLPPDLVLPSIPGSMECLSDETYQALVTRDELQKARRETLRAIIKTTHD